MQRVGVLYNPHAPASIELSQQLGDWLEERGCDVWRGMSQEGREHKEVITGLDLLVALGGDGTVLRAARLALACGAVPVLAVALGHLSFMAELQPEELYDGVSALLSGLGWHDERSLVHAAIYRQDQLVREEIALNEVVVAHADINRSMTVDAEIYETTFATYHADGVILATATGSTAYALAAGGPIVDPRSRELVMVPLAAHLTQIPSLVLHEDVTVRLRVRSRYPAVFSADGRSTTPLHENDVVEVRRAQQTCVFARVHPPSAFYSRMVQRLRPRV